MIGRDEYPYLNYLFLVEDHKSFIDNNQSADSKERPAKNGTNCDKMKEFEDTMKTRQAVLNQLSEETGNAVKWWYAGMNPSFLFIDEYVRVKC